MQISWQDNGYLCKPLSQQLIGEQRFPETLKFYEGFRSGVIEQKDDKGSGRLMLSSHDSFALNYNFNWHQKDAIKNEHLT